MSSNRFSNRSYAGQGDTAPAAIQNLPILRLEEGKVAKNDIAFKSFLDGMYTHCLRDFGILANIFKTGDYPVLTEPTITRAELLKINDPHGLKKEKYKQLLKMHLEKVERLESDKPRMFAVILGQVSNLTLDKVRRLPEWNKVHLDNDPKGLLQLIST